MAKCELCHHVHIGIKQCRAEVPLKKDPARFKLCRCPNQKAKSAAAPPRN